MHEPAWMQSQPAKFIKIQSNPIPCYKPKETLSNRQQHTGKHMLCFFAAFRIGASFHPSFWVHPFHLDFEPELVQRDDHPSKVLRRVYRPAGRTEQALLIVKCISWILECIGKLIKIQTSKNQGCKPFFEATPFMSLI